MNCDHCFQVFVYNASKKLNEFMCLFCGFSKSDKI